MSDPVPNMTTGRNIAIELIRLAAYVAAWVALAWGIVAALRALMEMVTNG